MAWFMRRRKQVKEEDRVYYEGIDVLDMSRKALRKALDAKTLSTSGGKRALQLRLMEVIQQEKEEEQAYRAAVMAARKSEAVLEESGSVYSVGLNDRGQLGMGDLLPRHKFTVLPTTRGKNVDQLYCGSDYVFALTTSHDVYAWGGAGKAPLALAPTEDELAKQKASRKAIKAGLHGDEKDIASDSDASSIDSNMIDDPDDENYVDPKSVRAVLARIVKYDKLPDGPMWASPIFIESLRGEGIVQLATGYTHCAAVSEGGDMYIWGTGRHGQLGNLKYKDRPLPSLVDRLQGVETQLTAVGFQHTVAVMADGRTMAWGHTARGRLGVGTLERKGVPPPNNHNFPIPTVVPAFAQRKVKQIACAAQHNIAIADDGVYTWGSGDGGRLGHGDKQDRIIPTRVEFFDNEIVLQVACGNWHSCAIMQVPPLLHGGYLYTWGSGYKGQLGHGKKPVVTDKPVLVDYFTRRSLSIAFVTCSSYHNAVLTDAEEMYTWGDNTEACLGNQLRDEFCDIPQKVWAFDVMIDGVGRGPPRSIACGTGFTAVALHPYTGPSEEELIAEEERAAAVEELDRLKEAEEELMVYEMKREKKRAISQAVSEMSKASSAVKMCSMCATCSGFKPNPFKASMCQECRHPKKVHQREMQDRGPGHGTG